MKISSFNLTFDHMSCTSTRSSTLLRGILCTKFGNTQVLQHSSKWVKRIWADNICKKKPSILTLTFEHVTRKLVWVFYYLGASTIGHHLYKDQQFDLDLWPCDLKISREHLISQGILCTKFDNFQAQKSKDIKWTLLGLQTDQETNQPTSAKQYAPFFQRRASRLFCWIDFASL